MCAQSRESRATAPRHAWGSSTPARHRHGPLRARCFSPGSLGVVAPSLARREGPALGGAGHVVGSSQGTHAAGVQGSSSSCNIPHMKYEAKFLLILQEEPGVNCVLPNSSSTCCSSSAFSPRAASHRGFPKSSFFSPCLKSEDSSQACRVHGLLGLGVQSKVLLRTLGGFHGCGHDFPGVFCWGPGSAGSACPSQAPARAVGQRRVSSTARGSTGTDPSRCLVGSCAVCRTGEDGGGTPAQSLPLALQSSALPFSPAEWALQGPSMCE